ncbi:MAG TPA: AIR synthase related protein, partial [Bacteroidales bacterium]|nr:AIR synthase related protein [Bacteroidales bacterium]
SKEPMYIAETKKFDINDIPENVNLREVADFLTRHPNIASKKWIYEQYDTMVRTVNMTTNRFADAGIINIKGTNTALAVTTDCNSRYVKSDPEKGAMIAVAEAARNVACTGAKPLAITNCLNFGSPYNPEAFWQFTNAVKGMGKACRAFGTPVTGGNVSFYNQTTIAGRTEPVSPTPTIGMLGILKEKLYQTSLAFRTKGDMIYMIGKCSNDIASSEYLYSYHKVKYSPAPEFDLDFEVKLVEILQQLAANGYVNSMHDVSDGGLYITLLESAMPKNLGFDITTPAEVRVDAFLFGESQGRVVVSVPIEKEPDFIDFMLENGFPFHTLGHVTKGELRIDDLSFGFIADEKEKYDNAIGLLMQS